MSETTAIEWCDSTFNPWIGCTRVSPACDDCYAARSTPTRALGVAWGAGQPRHRTSEPNWELPERWERQHAKFEAEHGRRRRVFCASLADIFDNEVPSQWRTDLFELIRTTPHLDWLLLTKRPQNIVRMVRSHGAIAGNGTRYLPDNAWLGTTAEDQKRADMNVPALLRCKAELGARVLFLSIEPMLGPIIIERATDQAEEGTINWVIAGGESGPKARPAHPDWFRALRDECEAFGVPFLFKQWGEWTPGENVERQRGTVDTAFLDDAGDAGSCWRVYPLNLATDHGHIDDQPDLYRVGKKAAGRLLDGVEHNGFPEAPHA